MAETTENILQSALEAVGLVCLPSALFFYEKLTVPAAVEGSELADFVELTLEGVSPFPLRDLYFGYLFEPANRSILIYAAVKKRVDALYPNAFASATFVIPSFALLYGFKVADNTLIALADDSGYEHVFIRAGGMPQPLDPSDASETPPRTELHLQTLDWAQDGALAVVFVGEQQENEPAAEHPLESKLTAATLWAADIRDSSFKHTERTRRRREKNLLNAIAIAGWAALFLIISQLGLWGFNKHVERLFLERDRRQPAVLTVQDRHGLLTTLEQVSAAELRPLDVLEAMNRLRPDQIHFTEMRAEPLNRITIEGIAGSVNVLNRYAESLRESGHFTVTDPRTLVRAGRTTFTLSVDYTGPLPVLPKTAESSANPGENQL